MYIVILSLSFFTHTKYPFFFSKLTGSRLVKLFLQKSIILVDKNLQNTKKIRSDFSKEDKKNTILIYILVMGFFIPKHILFMTKLLFTISNFFLIINILQPYFF